MTDVPTLSLSRLAFEKWRAALGEFRAAWKRKTGPSSTRVERQIAGFATLGALAAIALSAYLVDVPARQWAAELPGPVERLYANITGWGESGYIFALTALAGGVAILERGRGWGRKVDAGLTQLAARAMFLFCVCAVSGLASQALKHLFGRARPQLYDVVGPYHFDVFSIFASYASFPSGHTVTVFAMALAIYYLSPRVGQALFVAAILIALSRIIIGSHYFSDVVAGATLGIGSAMLVRREFCARGIVFAKGATGARLRGRGMIWKALRTAMF